MSPLTLGAMLFGSSMRTPDGATVPSPDGAKEGVRTIHAALDAGINVIDTADAYAGGESEELIGRALKGRRDDVLIATKAHVSMGDDPNMRGNSRRWIVRACEASLRRLGTDYIDLYQMHRPDPVCDIDETLGVLSDLVHAGKIRYIGGSGYTGSAIVEAQWTAERRCRERFVSEQAPFSMIVRGIEADVLPTCRRHRMGVLAYAPLAHGWLSGRLRSAQQDPTSRRVAAISSTQAAKPSNAPKTAAVDALAALADEIGVPLAQLAVAWSANHPAVSSVIVGVRSVEQLEGLLPAMEVTLDDGVLDRIDEIVSPGTTVDPNDSGDAWLYGRLVRRDVSVNRRATAPGGLPERG
ncbi:Predicted oxidoreductase [Pseudonocardia oroxyli]|uniref:Predicted oxidoreductase n=2 Tax=Pseudonocardia oroxyli TaxID=366584 RepID=A0A1G7TJ13_PSEOR|nr:Predicted oxidoreductase [Pseudonocardia oroxyli]